MRQNVGVGQFSKQYGGRNKRKGTVPEHYARASRGLIRHILKQVLGYSAVWA
jgi:ribosomal protein S19E (S16A)